MKSSEFKIVIGIVLQKLFSLIVMAVIEVTYLGNNKRQSYKEFSRSATFKRLLSNLPFRIYLQFSLLLQSLQTHPYLKIAIHRLRHNDKQ
jgi:hypothetical protein